MLDLGSRFFPGRSHKLTYSLFLFSPFFVQFIFTAHRGLIYVFFNTLMLMWYFTLRNINMFFYKTLCFMAAVAQEEGQVVL